MMYYFDNLLPFFFIGAAISLGVSLIHWLVDYATGEHKRIKQSEARKAEAIELMKTIIDNQQRTRDLAKAVIAREDIRRPN